MFKLTWNLGNLIFGNHGENAAEAESFRLVRYPKLMYTCKCSTILSYKKNIYVYSWNLLYLYGIMALCVHDLQIFWTTISTPQLWNCEIQMAKCPAVFATRHPLPIATVGFADSMIVWLPRGATCVKRLYLRTAARLLTIEGSFETLSRFWWEVIAHSTIYHHLPYKIRN